MKLFSSNVQRFDVVFMRFVITPIIWFPIPQNLIIRHNSIIRRIRKDFFLDSYFNTNRTFFNLKKSVSYISFHEKIKNEFLETTVESILPETYTKRNCFYISIYLLKMSHDYFSDINHYPQ